MSDKIIRLSPWMPTVAACVFGFFMGMMRVPGLPPETPYINIAVFLSLFVTSLLLSLIAYALQKNVDEWEAYNALSNEEKYEFHVAETVRNIFKGYGHLTREQRDEVIDRLYEDIVDED